MRGINSEVEKEKATVTAEFALGVLNDELQIKLNKNDSMTTTEKSEIKSLTNDDFNQISQILECEPAALKAVQQVETGGRGGFFPSGKPAILFEGHIFGKQLQERGLNPKEFLSGNEDILFPRWNRRFYKDGICEYDRLEKARKIHKEAADASTSWGMFQIMGFNYAACDEASVESFVQSMCKSESKQLLLFANFIKNNGKMLHALQSKDWAAFAKCYNGPRYAENRYDVKLEGAYRKFKGSE